MKKLKFGIAISFITIAMVMVGCKNDILEVSSENTSEKISIGDDVIYGEEFSLSRIYSENARAASISDEQMTKMVYFSVCPETVDEVYKVNDVMGFLNPIMMNREILQTCDAESLIIKQEISDTGEADAENLLNLGINYYYIVEKEKADELADVLKNYSVIEEFSIPTDEFVEESDEEDYVVENNSERSVFSKSYIYGTVQYSINGKTIPADGIKMRRGLSTTCQTNENGKFSLGYSRNICGLSWLWADYENVACVLSNILNLNASTLLKVAFPSKLSNITINATSNYATAKMAICNEVLHRYKQELDRGNTLKKARIWTTELGNGTSSAPCFTYLEKSINPDIFLTECNKYAANEKYLKILHHEYTHYVHCLGTENKSKFYNDVIKSEINSSINYTITEFINKFLENKIDVNFYDFSNAHVLFTENLAEWYSLVGYENGAYGECEKVFKNNGTAYTLGDYDCQQVFTNLVLNKILSANDIIDVIITDDVINFQEFYNSLIKRYSNKQNKIQTIFENSYVAHGNELEY